MPDIIRIVNEASEDDVTNVIEYHEFASDAGNERVSVDEGLHLMMGRLVIGLLRMASSRQFKRDRDRQLPAILAQFTLCKATSVLVGRCFRKDSLVR